MFNIIKSIHVVTYRCSSSIFIVVLWYFTLGLYYFQSSQSPLPAPKTGIIVMFHLLLFPFPTESFLAPFLLLNMIISSLLLFLTFQGLYFSLAFLFLMTLSLFHSFSLFFMNPLSPPPSNAKYYDGKQNTAFMS